MKIKNIVFDLDGTLLNSDYQISLQNKQFLQSLIAKNINIILASGRSPNQMIHYAQEINCSYIISLNGSIIFDVKKMKLLDSHLMNNNTAETAYDYCIKKNLSGVFYIEQLAHCSHDGPFCVSLGFRHKRKISIIKKNNIQNVEKIILYFNSSKKANEELMLLKELFKNKLNIELSGPTKIDLNPLNISKASGLKFLEKIKKIDPQSTLVFGDSGNDLEMFKWAKYGFAMENAIEELKIISNQVIGDNNSETISEVLTKIIKK